MDYIRINRDSWNQRTEVHVGSDFYQMEDFLKGQSSLQTIECALLGPSLQGQSVLHLQCHFGQDSISLSRMGAQVTGLDLSDKAIEQARQLAAQTGADTQFVCCDVYSAPQHLHQQFDIVFTTYGVLGWLPDMDQWAKVVAHFLKPGGRLILVEFHPVVWMFDAAFTKIAYSYFNREPIVETEKGTYADPNAPIEHQNISWNHSLSEVVGGLLRSGLQITHFEEYDYSPYNCFQNTIEPAPRQYRIAHLDQQLPMVYAVVARKSD